MLGRRRFAASLAVVLVAGMWCHGGPAAKRTAWQRIPLWSTPPAVELRPFSELVPPLFHRQVALLLAEQAAHPEPAPDRAPARQLEAGQVDSLAQAVGSRLRWRVALGAEPYLSFTPLGCAVPCTLRAGIRGPDGVIVELFRRQAGSVTLFAPRAAELDLGRWQGSAVDVLLQVDGDVHAGTTPTLWPQAQWATPVVYWRAAPAPGRARAAEPAPPPNILLLGVDTLRASAVGPHPGRVSLTPAMDRLAGTSDVYPDAFSVFNITNPSFTSILTGLYGKNHGVYNLTTKLGPQQPTLAALLAARGYDTFAVISARHLADPSSGLGRGFRTLVQSDGHFAAETAAGAAWDWIAQARPPFFAWVHLFDPHTPHTPPQPFASGERPAAASGAGRVVSWLPFRDLGPRTFDQPVLGGQSDLYDGEVAYLDREVGRLLDAAESRGLLDNTIVVLVADHGENLGEHGIFYRHAGLWETTTHVPLMVRWPRGEGRIRRGLVQTIDLFPTLLHAAGVAPPSNDGTDLGELIDGQRRGRSAVFAEHSDGSGAMVRTGRYKYFTSRGNPLIPDGERLFDLESDPGEERNLVGQGLAIETELAAVLRRWLSERRYTPGDTSPQRLSEEEQARLRALGYM